jgi:hypothetical protein
MNLSRPIHERTIANHALAQSTKSVPAKPNASTFEQKMHERNITHSDW